MKFQTAKNVSLALIMAGIMIGLLGSITLESGTSEYTFSFITMLVLVGLSLLILFVWGKCPKCKKRIFYQVYKYKKCPHCGASLTGDTKGKKGAAKKK